MTYTATLVAVAAKNTVTTDGADANGLNTFKGFRHRIPTAGKHVRNQKRKQSQRQNKDSEFGHDSS